MISSSQYDTPLFDALKKYVDDKVIQFHVPGHKQGEGLPELKSYIGETVLKMDANGMDDLDYATNPKGVILKAERLMADAFGSRSAYFLVNGTTSGVHAMIMSACNPGDEIILPRNAHKSAISGIIFSGAIPVFIQPEVNTTLGMSMGISVEEVEKAIKNHPNAKAIFIINPTYYGAASNLKAIVELAHTYNMAVLVDEAHGAHMYFHDDFPLNAMSADADMSAASLHKTGGSLTQSSVLLFNSNIISEARVKHVMDLIYTSSASYLLMCSLDIARKQLAIHGKKMLENTLQLARWARDELNNIDGVYAFGKELINGLGCYGFDETKLGINIRNLGISGYDMESILRKDYNIQVELSDLYNILAIVSIGDKKSNLEALINAFKDISSKVIDKKDFGICIQTNTPELVISPRDAFYMPKKTIKLEDSIGKVSGETIMAYPPGIPVICIGERLSKDIIDYISILKREKCHLQGASDSSVNYIKVINESNI